MAGDDVESIQATIYQEILKLEKKVSQLAQGLHHAAPPERAGNPTPSVQYLFAVVQLLAQLAKDCRISSNSNVSPS